MRALPLAAALLLALVPPPAAADGVPFTPRWVDEEQDARVTAPCCAFARLLANATDADDDGLYEAARLALAANGSLHRNVSTAGVPRVPALLVWLPNATWAASANATAWDSAATGLPDRAEADASLRLRHGPLDVTASRSVSCHDALPLVPGPDACA